jgi:hypothetical protein
LSQATGYLELHRKGADRYGRSAVFIEENPAAFTGGLILPCTITKISARLPELHTMHIHETHGGPKYWVFEESQKTTIEPKRTV